MNEIRIGRGNQSICKDCGHEFTMTEREKEWFTSKGLSVPKRCERCRAKKREANNR